MGKELVDVSRIDAVRVRELDVRVAAIKLLVMQQPPPFHVQRPRKTPRATLCRAY